MTDQTEFAEGLIVKAPRAGAPSFVRASISIKRDEFIVWLSTREGDWVNLDVKESKGGKWYAAVNTYKPKEGAAKLPPSTGKIGPGDDDIPF